MRALRSVANADDECIANKDRGLAIADFAVYEMGRARHHEQLVAKDADLGQLMGLEGILDGQRMETVIFLELPQFRFGGFEQPDPDELGPVLCASIRLVERNGPSPLAVAIEIGGHNAHAAPPTKSAFLRSTDS